MSKPSLDLRAGFTHLRGLDVVAGVSSPIAPAHALHELGKRERVDLGHGYAERDVGGWLLGMVDGLHLLLLGGVHVHVQMKFSC